MLILNPLELTLLICRVAFLISILLILAHFTIALVYSLWPELIALKKNWIDLRKNSKFHAIFASFAQVKKVLSVLSILL
jgi:hypothetical protein